MATVLVTGGVWWSGGGDPADRRPAAGVDAKATPGVAAAESAPGAPAADDDRGSTPQAAPRSRTVATQGPADAAEGADRASAAPSQKPKPKPKPKAKPKPAPPPAPLSRSRPTLLAVPAITVEAPVVDLGLDRQGRLDVPPVDDPRKAGWYARGPAPGERGTAVMVGHRDTRTGPAVFLDLDSLGPGNTVRVARADGRVAVFTVDRVRTYPKSAFPDEEVYGSTGRPELRLLTCGGAYDRGSGYDSNIVVFAHLTDVDRTI
ncbi:class F sortase [Streptomyces sp. CC208A]|uniref:class F sortase n=1 Tax=Streptomyces sp. CC208A TaxID=3044573 RepID=UPI0024A9068E|nr:class F sortase [Streptomyces sp. CC208A]